MLNIGLTGGIATGKSHVRRRFAEAGLPTLDLDAVTHELLAADGAGQRAVLAAFGPQMLAPGGEVDRQRLGAHVFGDPAARARLDACLHPLIRAAGEQAAAQAAARGASAFVTEAALLVETGGHLRFDRLVVVHCPVETQLARLRARDGLDEDGARARLAAQMPMDTKRRFAHVTIDSSGTPHGTDARADAAARDLLECAALTPSEPPQALTARLALALHHGPQTGPRGLHPARVVARVAEQRGVLDLQALVALVDEARGERWYELARPGEGDPGPEALAFVVAAWAQARRPGDESFLAGAAVSLARLTHADPSRVGLACLLAGLAWDLLDAPAVNLVKRAGFWREHARVFGARPPLAPPAFAVPGNAPANSTDAALCAVRDALRTGSGEHPGHNTWPLTAFLGRLTPTS